MAYTYTRTKSLCAAVIFGSLVKRTTWPRDEPLGCAGSGLDPSLLATKVCCFSLEQQQQQHRED